MMKRLFILLLTLCSLSGYSQTITQYLGTKTNTVLTQGGHKVDSALYLPTVQKYNPTWAGAIRYNAADSSLYYYSGTQWIKAGAGGGPEWDSYNSHDTLTQSRGIWMQTYGLTFYSSDGTTQNATGINNDGFTSRRGNGSLTQNSTWVYGQIQDPTSTYISRFQAIGLTNDSTHSTSMISTNGKTYNRKAALVSAGWSDGVKLQVNTAWKTSGSATGYKGITLYSTNGDGAGELTIDKEVIPEGTGQALLYDSVNKRVYRGTASGGGSSYKAFQTAVDGATVTFDMSLTDNWQVTIAGNRNFSFTNASNGQFLTLKLTQDATGSREPVWPASFKWIGATAPDFSDTGGTTDIITAVYDGTTWWANYGKNYN